MALLHRELTQFQPVRRERKPGMGVAVFPANYLEKMLRDDDVVMLRSRTVSMPEIQAGAADSGQRCLRAGDANR